MLLVTFNSLVASDAEQVRSKVVLCLWQEARKEQNQFLLFFFLANERACLLKKTRVFYLKLTMWHVLPLLCTSNKRIRTGYKCKARRQHLLVLLCLLVLCYLRLEGRKKGASSLHKGAIVCILTVHPTDGSQDATRASSCFLVPFIALHVTSNKAILLGYKRMGAIKRNSNCL